MRYCGCLRSDADDDGQNLPPRPCDVSVGTSASNGQSERQQNGKNSQVIEKTPHIELWERAAQLARDSGQLTKKEYSFLGKTSGELQNKGVGGSGNPLIDVLQAANDAKKDLQDGKLSFTTRNGKKVAVQERFESLMSGLETYSGMVETLASTSEYASLVWGIAKFFFQIIWNKIEILEKVQEVLAKIIMTMAVSQVCESIYTERVELVNLQIDKEAAKTMALRMGLALPELHAAILVFAIKARTYFKKAQTVLGAFTTAIKPFDAQFKPYVDKIREEQQAVQELAGLADMVTTQGSSKRIEKMQSDMSKIRNILAPLEKKLNSIHSDVQDTRKDITALQEEHALEWLDAVDQRQSFQVHQEQRVLGTCQWILGTPEYKQWKAAAPSGPNLWICDKAGTGKTILASFITQDLVKTQDTYVLTVFFGPAAGNLSSMGALSGLILQLLHIARDLDRDCGQDTIWGILMERLKGTIQKHAGFSNRGKTVGTLQHLLTEMLEIFRRNSERSETLEKPKRVVVLLDALDACPDPGALIGSPDSPLGSSVAVIVTSRNTAKVADILEGDGDSNPEKMTLRIPMHIEEDIGIFIDSKTANHPKLAGHRDAILHIIQKTKNTLRFSNLLLEDLASQPAEAISESLANMRLGLDSSSAAAGLPAAIWKEPFFWAAWLGNHLSLQLLLDESPQPFSPQQVSQAILYASKHGHTRAVQTLLDYHADTQQTQPVVAAVAQELLSQALQRDDAALVGVLVQQPYVNPNYRNEKGQTLLTVAAKGGRANAVRALLTHPMIQINAQEDTEDTALVWAAYNGHTECARLLLEHPDIDPNVQNNYCDVALTYAMRYAFVDVVRLLVSHPTIDIDVPSPYSKAPIHEAVTRAPRGAVANECLKLLIDAGADVNKRRGHNTTLALAAEYGYDDQVAILLTSPNLDRECLNEAGETPLMTAKRLGHDKVVALLQ